MNTRVGDHQSVAKGRIGRLSVQTLESLATGLVFIVLHRLRLLGSLPLLTLLLLLGGATLVTNFVRAVGQPGGSPVHHHLRLAAQMLMASAIIYAIGWGPTLAVGFVVIASEDLRLMGSSAWRPATLWALVGIGAGEGAIAANLVPTYVGEPYVHGLAVLAALGVAFVVGLLGLKTQALEEKTAALEAESAQRATAEESVRRSERRFRSLVQNSFDVVTVIDASGQIKYTSPSVERVLGFTPEEYIRTPGPERIHPDDLAEATKVTSAVHLDPTLDRTWEVRVKHRNGTWRWHEVTLRNLLDDPAVAGIVANHRDITDRKAYQDRLAHEARHDSLTGLPNRKAFFERLEGALELGRRRGTGVALLFVDLDRFKLINDTLGHIAGDRLLAAVSDRLVESTRPGDVVARLSGDEFIILLEDSADPAEVAERLAEALRQPLELAGRRLVVTASVGVAVSETSAESPEDLLSHADLAMYAAKEGGRARSVVFDPGATPQFVERVELEAGLRSAVQRRELLLHYQPIVDPRTREIKGFEALVRWQHPGRGLLAPSGFIGLAEETGLIETVGRWVLEEACRTLADWRGEFAARPLMMSVNVSAVQLHEPGFAGLVADVTAKSGVSPSSLVLEITEGVLVRPEKTLEVLQELRTLGVGIALDDFGTGYSSLGYLRRLPLDFIKIDRTFIEDLGIEDGDNSIVRAINDLARNLGLRVIAEGVETEEQARSIAGLGCELAQGYLYSRPQPRLGARSLLGGRPPAVARGARAGDVLTRNPT